MAFEDYDDYEKSEHVQQWLRENAVAIVSGIVLGLLLLFGINQWRQHRVTHQTEAAAEYQNLVQAIQKGDQPGVDAASQTLQSKYKDTPFAVFSAFQQAKLAVDDNKPEQANKALLWAQAHASNPAIRELAGLRLAQAALSAGNPDQTITTLAKIKTVAYAGLASEIKGDALAAQGKSKEARSAYELAIQDYEANDTPTGLLQLKLDNLAAAGKGNS